MHAWWCMATTRGFWRCAREVRTFRVRHIRKRATCCSAVSTFLSCTIVCGTICRARDVAERAARAMASARSTPRWRCRELRIPRPCSTPDHELLRVLRWERHSGIVIELSAERNRCRWGVRRDAAGIVSRSLLLCVLRLSRAFLISASHHSISWCPVPPCALLMVNMISQVLHVALNSHAMRQT